MTDDYIGSWFFVRTTDSEKGSAKYPEAYKIDGTNGYINLRDYVVWTGAHLIHICNFEAKASTEKGADGKYSWKSGVDGRMSSTDKAYLTDLINNYWGKVKLPLFPDPDPKEGWQCNWCRETGIYLGGLKMNCGGHPPVLNDNHTSWVLMVFNGMATDAESLNRNHRLQVAFDLVNSKIYMRRGWMSAGTWADWVEVGGGGLTEIADGSITTAKIANGAIDKYKLADDVIEIIDNAGKAYSGITINEGGYHELSPSNLANEYVIGTPDYLGFILLRYGDNGKCFNTGDSFIINTLHLNGTDGITVRNENGTQSAELPNCGIYRITIFNYWDWGYNSSLIDNYFKVEELFTPSSLQSVMTLELEDEVDGLNEVEELEDEVNEEEVSE